MPYAKQGFFSNNGDEMKSIRLILQIFAVLFVVVTLERAVPVFAHDWNGYHWDYSGSGPLWLGYRNTADSSRYGTAISGAISDWNTAPPLNLYSVSAGEDIIIRRVNPRLWRGDSQSLTFAGG